LTFIQLFIQLFMKSIPDIRVLIGNDALLQRGLAKNFEQYNNEQFTPVDMPGHDYKVIFFFFPSEYL